MQDDIQVGRYSDILGRLLSMAGVQAVAGQLSAEISAVLALEVDRPEWAFLGGEKLCSANQLVALSAGNRSVVRFRNPANGPLAVITNVQVSTSTAGTWTAAANLGAIAADRGALSGAFVNLDTRWGVAAGNAACIVSGDNAAVAGTNFEAGHILAGTTYRFQATPIIVAPGGFVEFYFVETDQLIRCTIRWRERPMVPYEQAR